MFVSLAISRAHTLRAQKDKAKTEIGRGLCGSPGRGNFRQFVFDVLMAYTPSLQR